MRSRHFSAATDGESTAGQQDVNFGPGDEAAETPSAEADVAHEGAAQPVESIDAAEAVEEAVESSADSSESTQDAVADEATGADEAPDADEASKKKSLPPLNPVITALRADLAKKDEQLKSYITAYKQATADMERQKTRMERDREKQADRDRMAMATKLLDVLDNFDRSLDSGRNAGAPEDLLAGLDLVQKQFVEALTELGVERMTALGTTFDPSFHEATGMVPASGEQRDQEVIYEERTGYRFRGQLLRPARVVVASRPD